MRGFRGQRKCEKDHLCLQGTVLRDPSLPPLRGCQISCAYCHRGGDKQAAASYLLTLRRKRFESSPFNSEKQKRGNGVYLEIFDLAAAAAAAEVPAFSAAVLSSICLPNLTRTFGGCLKNKNLNQDRRCRGGCRGTDWRGGVDNRVEERWIEEEGKATGRVDSENKRV